MTVVTVRSNVLKAIADCPKAWAGGKFYSRLPWNEQSSRWQISKRFILNTRLKKVIGIATAAVRQAKNQAKFLRAVKEQIGISLKVLSGNQEAYYDYLGVINRLGIKNCLILDIGGASCELIRVNNGESSNLTSIPVGAVNITERYHLNDNITGANLFNAQFNIRKIYSKIDWLNRATHQRWFSWAALIGRWPESIVNVRIWFELTQFMATI